MNKKLKELYAKYQSLPECMNKNIAWAMYHNYRIKLNKPIINKKEK